MVPVDSGSAPALRAAVSTAAITAVAVLVLVVVVLLVDMRSGLAPAGDRATARADALAAQLADASPAQTRAVLRSAGGPARVVDDGQVVASVGPAAVWRAGASGLPARMASAGAGWDPRAGAVEASRSLPGGSRLEVRGQIGEAATSLTPAVWFGLAGALFLGALAGLAVGVRTQRRRRAASALAVALASGPGRATRDLVALPDDLRTVAGAVDSVNERLREHDEAVEAGLEVLSAALTPLALPVATRTSGGRLLRNDAMASLLGELSPTEAAEVDAAAARALSGSGPVSQRLPLADGRVFAVEAWPVPAGRVVAMVDRGEQERLAALRRRISAGAARRLRAPIEELQGLSRDLHAAVSAAQATTTGQLMATADRLSGLTRAMVRGTDHDLAPAPRPERIGPSGLLWGLARGDEDRLRALGLRLEIEVADDAPAIWADLDQLQLVMTSLVANAERFTPRGGTITLWATAAGPGRAAIGVRDTGPGVGAAELRAVFEPFVRGGEAVAHPGDGLGLSGARALVERIGGRLTIEPGRGGGPRVELPASEGDRHEGALAA